MSTTVTLGRLRARLNEYGTGILPIILDKLGPEGTADLRDSLALMTDKEVNGWALVINALPIDMVPQCANLLANLPPRVRCACCGQAKPRHEVACPHCEFRDWGFVVSAMLCGLFLGLGGACASLFWFQSTFWVVAGWVWAAVLTCVALMGIVGLFLNLQAPRRHELDRLLADAKTILDRFEDEPGAVDFVPEALQVADRLMRELRKTLDPAKVAGDPPPGGADRLPSAGSTDGMQQDVGRGRRLLQAAKAIREQMNARLAESNEPGALPRIAARCGRCASSDVAFRCTRCGVKYC